MKKLSRAQVSDLFAMFKLPAFRKIQWTAEDPQHVREQMQELFEYCAGDMNAMVSALMNSAAVGIESNVDGLCQRAKQIKG
jgi:hypothetical protein